MQYEDVNKYELAYIIGVRMLQLEAGAVPVSTFGENVTTMEIAREDVRSGLLPYVIYRRGAHGDVPYKVTRDFKCRRVSVE